MFTGIIEEIGKVERIQKDTCNCKLSIKASKILEDIHLGDSIAVNGICLTVTCFTRQSFTVDVMNETWNRTALSLLWKPCEFRKSYAYEWQVGRSHCYGAY